MHITSTTNTSSTVVPCTRYKVYDVRLVTLISYEYVQSTHRSDVYMLGVRRLFGDCSLLYVSHLEDVYKYIEISCFSVEEQ